MSVENPVEKYVKFGVTIQRLPSFREACICWKSRESKNRLRIIVKRSTLFYDDRQQRKDRDQADDDRRKMCIHEEQYIAYISIYERL